MQITMAYLAIAALARHDGVKDIKSTEPCGIWRRELGDWRITLNANGEERPWSDDSTVMVPPFGALLECSGWPCGVIDPAGGAIASVGGASEGKLIKDIEAEIGCSVEDELAKA
jgi:hypothetical protein